MASAADHDDIEMMPPLPPEQDEDEQILPPLPNNDEPQTPQQPPQPPPQPLQNSNHDAFSNFPPNDSNMEVDQPVIKSEPPEETPNENAQNVQENSVLNEPTM